MNTTIKLNQPDIKKFPIPDVLNVFILLGAAVLSLILLKLCSQSDVLWEQVLYGILFSFTVNTIFSLLHEAVHGHLHSHAKVNHLLGMVCAAFFPTGYSLQRAFHLSHHKNNRTEKEQFDFVSESDNKFIKYAQWYCILSGLYWLFAVLGAILILLIPDFLIKTINRSKLALQTGADSMFARLKEENYFYIRLELLFSVGVQFLIYYYLHPSLMAYIICYGLFAINWSSLQYADHAFSVLDAKEGAWNLRVTKFTQYLFLNYHAHKVHHKYMNMPWLYLYKFVPKDEYKPKFITLYLEMWKGPKSLPKDAKEANLNHPAFTHLNGEWVCLKEFYHFSKRNFRYFKIGLFLYLPAFIQFKKLRTFRYGFALLQHIDDVMDGDRKFEGNPLDMVTSIKQQIKAEIFEPSTTGILAAVLFKSIKNSEIDKEELKAEVLTLIEIMESDYKRRQQRLVLNKTELDEILRATFYHSINLAMVLWQSPIRANQTNHLIKLFNWCTVVRDFREDLDVGIINIPKEILDAAGLNNQSKADVIIADETVRVWIQANYENASQIIQDSTNQLNTLKAKKGEFLLRIFHNSMCDYHKNFQSHYSKL